MLGLRQIAFLAVIPVLTACGDDDRMPVDSGPITLDGSMDAATVDAGFDAGPSILFGPCTSDEQCPGAGAVCRRPENGWPEGYCTIPCPGGDRGPCDDGFRFNECVMDEAGEWFCEQRCLNGADCGRPSYTCEGTDGMTAGICVGLCSSNEDCGAGADCNVWSGECVSAGSVPTAGSETGGECADDMGCKSDDCIQGFTTGFTGWTDGYCIGLCILPMGYNTNTFYSGETLPQGTCAGDAICWPGAGSYTRGDIGVCLDGCTTDADCRQDDAYRCLKEVGLASGGTSTYTNGVCLPIDCATDACPTGFTCQSISTTSGTIRRCQRT